MKRYQRTRKKGYRSPPNSRYVGRGTKWGSPYKIIPLACGKFGIKDTRVGVELTRAFLTKREAAQFSIEQYEIYARECLRNDPHWLDDLRPYDELGCFCALDMPCHVDVIIKLLEATR